MNLVPVPLGEALKPGASYFLEFDAPAGALDRLSRSPEVGQAIVSAAVDVSGIAATYEGSGVAWSNAAGAAKRVYMVRLETPSTPAAPVVGGAVPIGRVVIAVSAVLVAAGVMFWGVKFYRLEDVPGVVEDVRDTARSAANITGWIVFGGLAVGGYLVAKRQGWLS